MLRPAAPFDYLFVGIAHFDLDSVGHVKMEPDMKAVGVTMARWEFRQKWYEEDESTSRRMAGEVGKDVPGSMG